MDPYMQAGIVIITIAFLILMYSIIQTLKVLKSAIEEMRLMIGQVRTDVSHISDDMKEAIHNTNAMTMDVRKKLSSLNILFATVNDIGQALHSFTGAAKTSAAELTATIQEEHQVDHNENKEKKANITGAIIDGVISTLRILKKIKHI